MNDNAQVALRKDGKDYLWKPGISQPVVLPTIPDIEGEPARLLADYTGNNRINRHGQVAIHAPSFKNTIVEEGEIVEEIPWESFIYQMQEEDGSVVQTGSVEQMSTRFIDESGNAYGVTDYEVDENQEAKPRYLFRFSEGSGMTQLRQLKMKGEVTSTSHPERFQGIGVTGDSLTSVGIPLDSPDAPEEPDSPDETWYDSSGQDVEITYTEDPDNPGMFIEEITVISSEDGGTPGDPGSNPPPGAGFSIYYVNGAKWASGKDVYIRGLAPFGADEPLKKQWGFGHNGGGRSTIWIEGDEMVLMNRPGEHEALQGTVLDVNSRGEALIDGGYLWRNGHGVKLLDLVDRDDVTKVEGEVINSSGVIGAQVTINGAEVAALLLPVVILQPKA